MRRRGSAHSQFGHCPLANIRWQQVGQAPSATSSIAWLAQATQILGGPTWRYGQLGHFGNPGGGPTGRSAAAAMDYYGASKSCGCCSVARMTRSGAARCLITRRRQRPRWHPAWRYSRALIAGSSRGTLGGRLSCGAAMAPEVALASITTVPWLSPDVTTLRRGERVCPWRPGWPELRHQRAAASDLLGEFA